MLRTSFCRRRQIGALLALAVLLTAAIGPGLPEAGASSRGAAGRASLGCGGLECHKRSPTVTANLSGVPPSYVPRTAYRLIIYAGGQGPAVDPTSAGAHIGGFSLVTSNGRFALLPQDQDLRISANGRDVTHTEPAAAKRLWVIEWTAPDAGEVIFILSVLAADDDRTEQGDGFSSETYKTEGPPGSLSRTQQVTVVIVAALVGLTVVGLVALRRRVDVSRRAAKPRPATDPSEE